jgi:LysM repeat protein
VKTRQYLASFTPFFSYFFLIACILIFTGCIQRPLLLRNRPNVPPPSLDPNSDEIPETYGTGVIATPPVVIEVDHEITQITVPEIKDTPITHTVVKGDSFWKIARKYGVSKDELAECNNLDLQKPLKTGTVLVVPPGGTINYVAKPTKVRKKTPAVKTKPKKTSPVAVAATNNDGTYTVQSGDSLWKISRKFKITTKALIEANGIDRKRPILPGTKLVIPGAGAVVSSTLKSTQPPKPTEKPVDPIDDILKDAEKAKDNEISSTNADEVLKGLTDAAETAANPLPDDLYTEEVLPNETLQEIAERHGFTEEDLRKVNPGLPADGKLKPFESIKIPNKKY